MMSERRRLEGAIRSEMEGRARVMKALAHPSRLFIVDELSRGERCVCELTEMIGADVSTVSKHLALLAKRAWCSTTGAASRSSTACACPASSTSSAASRRCIAETGRTARTR
jgi:predicted transcriptional regulator